VLLEGFDSEPESLPIVHNSLKRMKPYGIDDDIKMVHPPYDPTVALLCMNCQKQTPHLLIDFSNNPLSALMLVYECQVCGQTKKTYDLNALPELKAAKIATVEQIELGSSVNTSAIPIERGPQIER